MNAPVVLAFLCYFGVLLGIGFFAHKRSQTESDFVLGDRSVNFWLTALSAHASDMSAWLFMSFPAAMYIGGVSSAWIGLGLVIGMFLNWQFIAEKLRTGTEASNSFTLSTFFEKRFGDESGILRLLTAIMTLVFLTIYLAAGLIAMGFLFESLFGINYLLGICIATTAVIAYTLFGGFVTVATVDFFQGIFLLFVIAIVPMIALYSIGGVDDVYAALVRNGRSVSLLPDESWLSFITALLLSFGWGLGYVGQPHIITKFMGIDQSSELRKSKYLGLSWQILALGAATAIGLIGVAFFEGDLQNPELVFVDMVKALFHPFIGGLVLCALVAANISTMDSQILVCASVVTEDIYKVLFRKKHTSSHLLKITRLSVGLVSVLSLLIAVSKNATVMETVFFSWSGLGCTFGPLVVTSLYCKHIDKYGAYAGILFGGLTAFIWPLFNGMLTDLAIPSLVVGFPLGLAAILFVGAFGRSR